MKRLRINPQKRELKEQYNKALDKWYKHHEKVQKCIVDICRSTSEEMDKAKELCNTLKQEAHDERIMSEEMDRIERQYKVTRWIIFE